MAAQDERDLRSVLRAEADRHEPDRAAMLRRINQARAAGPGGPRRRAGEVLRRPLSAVRPVAAATAVTAVLVLAIVGIDLAGRSSSGRPDPAAQPSSAPAASPAVPSRTPIPDGTGSPTGRSSPHRRVTSPNQPAATSASPPATTSVSPPAERDGYLSVVAVLDPQSAATWAQNDVTVSTTETVTALDVTVKVARTAGVAKTGHWSNVSDALVVQSVHTSDAALLYRFSLRPGATLAPGTYTFAAQYQHAAGTRSLAGDGWTADGTAQTGKAQMSGGFG